MKHPWAASCPSVLKERHLREGRGSLCPAARTVGTVRGRGSEEAGQQGGGAARGGAAAQNSHARSCNGARLSGRWKGKGLLLSHLGDGW